MTRGFWDNLPRPFFILAPLANVTDAPFRRLIAKYGKPDVFYTEFVSADGLCSPGRAVLRYDLMYTEAERPIVAQLFTAHPEKMQQAAAIAREMGFDGIDINMGCPDKAIEKQGAGAALIKTPALAREVIRAAKAGAGSLPVSVKTRIGYNKDILDEWLPELLVEEPAVVTIHARTRKEMSAVPAHWDAVARAVGIAKGSKTLIVGNGDVQDLDDARQKASETGVDGVMLGRAIFGTPWRFRRDGRQPSLEEGLNIMVEHTKLYEEILGGIKSFHLMKKHYKAYVTGFDGSKELRASLMETETATEVELLVTNFLKSISA